MRDQIQKKEMKKKSQSQHDSTPGLQSLLQQIKNETSHSHEARYDQNGRLFNSIANYGIKKNQIARLDRGGEYNGITIKALEDGSPQLNNQRICQILQLLDQKLEMQALQLIDDKFQKYGLPCLFYIVWKWLLKFNFPIPDIIDIQQNQHFENQSKQLLKEIDDYISREYQSPLEIPFSIQSPGYNEALDQSVIPEDWVDREFQNAEQLHREMDLLPWRIGKPKVTYCVTYCLNIVEEKNWQNQLYGKVDQLIHLSRDGDRISTTIIKNIEEFKENCQFLKVVKDEKSMVIAIKKEEFFIQEPNYDKKQTKVGVLASRLQKCIRRGRYCSKVLVETIKQLSKCKPYVLPEMKMIRVSASRQLLWRLYISTVEDSRPYLPTEGFIDMFSISCLAIICNHDPDCQLNEDLINLLIKTALAIQQADTDKDCWDWRMQKQRSGQFVKIKKNQKMTDFENSLIISLDYQPMMEGDKNMISNYLKIVKQVNATLQSPFKIYVEKLQGVEQIYSDPIIEKEAILASYDMHCFPQIIIQLQGLLPFVSDNFTTDKISSFIWEYSSKFNIRYSSKPQIKNEQEKQALQYLRQIQEELMNPIEEQRQVHQQDEFQQSDDLIPEHISRLGFLILFGQQFVHQIKNRKYAFSLSGNLQKPWNLKYAFDIDGKQIDEQTQIQLTSIFQDWIYNQTLEIQINQPPFGYVWRFENKTLKVNIKEGEVIIQELNLQIPYFDTTSLLQKRGRAQKKKLNEEGQLYLSELLTIIPQRPHLFQNQYKSNCQQDWLYLISNSKLPVQQIFSILYTRIRMNEQIQFSITRSGNKSNQELSKQFEGMIYRMMHVLQYCYPTAFIRINNIWHIQKQTQNYYDMLEDIKIICLMNKRQNQKDHQNNFRLVTKLWDHQKQTVDRMVDGYLNQGKRGFGDASCVGSGKTLTAISTAIQLLETNKLVNDSFRAFLVLVPQKLLLQTWIDEIRKHSKGYHLVVQLQNGNLQELFEGDVFDDKVRKNIPDAAIFKHTIILSTLGRFRDHGIRENKLFYLIIVDECLSIQNNDAFQTQEACKQSLLSKYGCLLLSATFFRSRFDKLFYLLSILQTQLPTNRQYLDTILNECMICYINENQRIWTSDVHKFQLPQKEKQLYEQTKQQDLPSDKKYIKLQQIIHQIDIVPFIQELIQIIQSDNRRILIYASSKAEAETISQIPNISLYPNLNGRHVVVSYNIGVYGLNDLVCLDTIITRPPEPDKLPQMKGRLDRPGQQKDQLNIQYFMFENTIEEAGLVRLDIASRFINSYIMPLAQFYNLAINM